MLELSNVNHESGSNGGIGGAILFVCVSILFCPAVNGKQRRCRWQHHVMPSQ